MTRSRVNKIPGLKEERKAVKLAQAEPVRKRMSYEERLETQGSGVPKKPKYYGEKPLRKVVAEHADKKVKTKVDHLNESGHVDDARSIAEREKAKKAKMLYTKGLRKKILRKRREQRQRDVMENQFNANVAQTYGQDVDEFLTLHEAEQAKEYKTWIDGVKAAEEKGGKSK